MTCPGPSIQIATNGRQSIRRRRDGPKAARFPGSRGAWRRYLDLAGYRHQQEGDRECFRGRDRRMAAILPAAPQAAADPQRGAARCRGPTRCREPRVPGGRRPSIRSPHPSRPRHSSPAGSAGGRGKGVATRTSAPHPGTRAREHRRRPPTPTVRMRPGGRLPVRTQRRYGVFFASPVVHAERARASPAACIPRVGGSAQE